MPNHRSKLVIWAFTVAATLFSAALQADNEIAPPTEDLGQGYTRKGEFIFFQGKRIDQEGKADIDRFSRAVGRQLTLCSEVDAATFKVLSEAYTKDKNKVYYKWISPGRFWVVELPEADAASFEVLGADLARDKQHVWWYGAAQPEVEAATVKLVNDGFVWKDARSVWYQRERIAGADSKTFRHLGSGYYIDALRAYWCTDPMDGADLATFRVLGDSFFALDRNMVYLSGRRLPHIDPGTCKYILHDPYGYQVISDKNGVYLNDLKFLHADPDDFKMVDKLTGRSGKYVFLVDRYHITPVTVYREGERVVTETVLYETGTTNPLAIVKADVSGDKLRNITFSPAPGKAAALPVPDWQMNIFKRTDLVKRMNAAGELLRADDEGSTPRAETKTMEAAETGDESDTLRDLAIVAFDKRLGELAAEARVPEKEALLKRITARPGGGGLDTEVMPITDGAGGFVDLKPAKDTVQFRVNQALKGQIVKWDFALAADAAPNYLGLMMLHPKFATKPDAEEKEKAVPFLNTIIVKAPKAEPLKIGDRVKLEGTIGDSSANRGTNIYSGPVAIYHLDAAPHTVFWVGLTKATITRLNDKPVTPSAEAGEDSQPPK